MNLFQFLIKTIIKAREAGMFDYHLPIYFDQGKSFILSNKAWSIWYNLG